MYQYSDHYMQNALQGKNMSPLLFLIFISNGHCYQRTIIID